MAQLGVIGKTEPQSNLVLGQAEPAEPSYIGVTTAFGKTVFIGDEAGLQTLRLAGDGESKPLEPPLLISATSRQKWLTPR